MQINLQNKMGIELSFDKGFKLLNDHQKLECKKDIKDALNIKSDQGFGKRRRGEVQHSIIEVKLIEQAFAKHKIKPKDIWGQ